MSKPLLARALDLFALRSQGRYSDTYGEPGYPHPDDYRDRESDSGVIPLRGERSEFAGVTIIRAEPMNMEEATAVADEIKHRLPVVLNLQSAHEGEAGRIRDFIGGVTYGLNGHMRRIAEWVYVCSPFDMPVERLVLSGGGPSSRERDDLFGAPEDH